MVNEDTILEKETAQKGGQIKQWKRDVQQAYAKHGFQGPDDGPDGGVDGDVDVDMDGQVSSFVIV